MTTDHTCPRCLGSIPNVQHPGAYPGALSRYDNKTEICSACGIDEAMNNFQNIRLTGPDDWPHRDMT